MRSQRGAWMWGAAAGFAIAAMVILVALAGPSAESPAGHLVRFLAASPVFALPRALAVPEAVQAVLLLAWWSGTGAIVGWCAGRGRRGRAAAGFLAAAIVATHLLTKIRIERDIEAAGEGFAAFFLQLMR